MASNAETLLADTGRIKLHRDGKRVTVSFNGTEIANTTQAITLREGSYTPALYVPMADVVQEHLIATSHSSHCPFKGQASYWSISANGETAENAVWAYNAPRDDVALIKDHVAFYPDRVTISVE